MQVGGKLVYLNGYRLYCRGTVTHLSIGLDMVAVDKKNDSHKKMVRNFLLLLFCSCSMLGGVLLFFNQQHINNSENSVKFEEKHSIYIQNKVIKIHLTAVISDLLSLSEQHEVSCLLAGGCAKEIDFINADYRHLSKFKQNYDQIRLLDNDGQEVVRINYNNGQPVSVVGNKLQSKQKRYYFKDAHKLNKGEVYISPFDLNMEHGQVEQPLKPMIRFGTPVFNDAGDKLGIVLLNYRGQNVLDLIRDLGAECNGEIMLLNPQGYWLQHPDPNKEWGFMFAERKQHNFAQQFPEVWQQMKTQSSAQVQTAAGIFTFTTINPLAVDFISSSGSANVFEESAAEISAAGYYWQVVSFISTDTLGGLTKGYQRHFFLLVAVLFVVIAAASWLLVSMLERRRQYQQQMYGMAHFDALTGLPNRVLFSDRLNQALLLAKRNESLSALFFLDLDGFKPINDTFGHAAGDELLITVAKRLLDCCRESDTVARIGGDEFTIVVNEIKTVADCEIIAEKILTELSVPFALQEDEVTIGVSIGIATYPVNGSDAELLLKNADHAMYAVKSGGKNTYKFAANKMA